MRLVAQRGQAAFIPDVVMMNPSLHPQTRPSHSQFPIAITVTAHGDSQQWLPLLEPSVALFARRDRSLRTIDASLTSAARCPVGVAAELRVHP